MPLWEAAQLVLGLCVPPLLIGHIVGTRFSWWLLGHNGRLRARRRRALVRTAGTSCRQSLLLLIVWAHLCFGLHYWLRLSAGTRRCSRSRSPRRCSCPALALAGFTSAGFGLGRDRARRRHAEVRPRARRHERRATSAARRLARGPDARLLGAARGDAARALAAHAHRRHLPAAPFVRPHHHRAGRAQHPRGAARRGHPARLGVRRARALHHLPRARRRRPGEAGGALTARSAGAGAHRRAAERAPRVPDAAARRRRRGAAAAPGCRPGRGAPPGRAAGARARRWWRCSSTCANRPSCANRACPTTRCSS